MSNKLIFSKDTPQRLDNFLFAKLKGVPKSLIYRLLRSGHIRVNKKRSKPSDRLEDGDVISLPKIRLGKEQERPAVPNKLIKLLENAVIYEDRELLAINKPPGLSVHGGTGVPLGVIEIMRAARPEAKFLELVHRLDRDTSGCLLLAKKSSVLKELHELFRSSQISKTYLTLLKGRLKQKNLRIEEALQQKHLQSGERMTRVTATGKESLTVFKSLQKFAMATLTEAKIYTGRTHQIRVHAAHIGHPVAGDSKYGEKIFNRQMAKLGLNRMFLHARELQFKLPATEKLITITADLDENLQNFLVRNNKLGEF